MWIKGGMIFNPAKDSAVAGDIFIKGDLIEGIYPVGTARSDNETIDAAGMWVLPGLIDMHVHLREPGYEYKEDIHSGSLAAAAGGVTTMACMANTDPVNDNPSVTRQIIDRAVKIGLARVLPVGAVTRGQKGKELAEIGIMKETGIVAVSDDGQPVEDSSVMRSALEYAATFGLTVLSHPQVKSLCGSGVMNEGALSTMLGLPGIPSAAEDIMIARDIELSRYTGVPVHITHVSTRGGIELIRQAKAGGVGITCDVTPHHLLLTEDAVKGYDTNTKMYPPLRMESDRFALIQGLRDAVIDCIATDHAPHARDEKDLDYDLAPFGIIGLQTLLPAMMEIHYRYGIDFLKLLRCVSIHPARILGIDGGTLTPGSRADITVVDPDKVFTLTKDMIVSKSKNTPFIGHEFKGGVMQTIFGGKTVFDQG